MAEMLFFRTISGRCDQTCGSLPASMTICTGLSGRCICKICRWKPLKTIRFLSGGEVFINIYKVPVAQLRQPAHEAVGRGGIVPADVEKRLAAEIAVQHQDIRGGGGDQIELAAVELVEGDEQHAAGELGGKILHELLQREDVQLRALLRGKVRDALQQGWGRHPQPGTGDEHDGARIGARPGGRGVS